MKKLLSLLALTVVFYSCEKEIDYEIPNPGDKIVVSTQLLDGEEPLIYLSTSVYSMGNEEPKTSNIYTATLYSNHPDSPFELEAKLDNSNFENQYYYTTSHKIEAGLSYRLEVSAPNLDPVSASTFVPIAQSIENARFDTATKELAFSFKDLPQSSHYYWIEVKALNQFYPLYFSTADPSLTFFDSFSDPFGDGGDGRVSGTSAFLDDSQFNGLSKDVKIRLEDLPPNGFRILLHSISESYYRFRLTQSANGFSDGLFSEPVQLFSNVKGGYGIISGQSSDVFTINF